MPPAPTKIVSAEELRPREKTYVSQYVLVPFFQDVHVVSVVGLAMNILTLFFFFLALGGFLRRDFGGWEALGQI